MKMTMFLSWFVRVDEIMEDLVRFLGRVVRRVKVGELAAGYSFSVASSFAFDCVLYPWVIYKYGLVIGGIIMAGLSAGICLAMIEIYDITKRDWLGLEAIKESGRESFILSWFLRKGKFFQFVGLSLWTDPFVTTAFLRKGKFNGLTAGDRFVFWGSVLLSNGAWALAVFSGLMLVINISPELFRDGAVIILILLHGYITRSV